MCTNVQVWNCKNWNKYWTLVLGREQQHICIHAVHVCVIFLEFSNLFFFFSFLNVLATKFCCGFIKYGHATITKYNNVPRASSRTPWKECRVVDTSGWNFTQSQLMSLNICQIVFGRKCFAASESQMDNILWFICTLDVWRVTSSCWNVGDCTKMNRTRTLATDY